MIVSIFVSLKYLQTRRMVKDTSGTIESHNNMFKKVRSMILLLYPVYSFPVHRINSVIQVICGHPFWAGTVTIC